MSLSGWKYMSRTLPCLRSPRSVKWVSLMTFMSVRSVRGSVESELLSATVLPLESAGQNTVLRLLRPSKRRIRQWKKPHSAQGVSGAWNLLPPGARRDRRRRRLCRRPCRQSDLQAGLHRQDGPRRSRGSDLRSRESLLRQAGGRVLHEPRSDDAQPPGTGCRHAIPLRHLHAFARTGARGAREESRAGGIGQVQAARSSPRSSRPRRSGGPRNITSAISRRTACRPAT